MRTKFSSIQLSREQEKNQMKQKITVTIDEEKIASIESMLKEGRFRNIRLA